MRLFVAWLFLLSAITSADMMTSDQPIKIFIGYVSLIMGLFFMVKLISPGRIY